MPVETIDQFRCAHAMVASRSYPCLE